MLRLPRRALSSNVVLSALAFLAACGHSAAPLAGQDEALTGTDPRPALKDHTFHVARSILTAGAFENQGGAMVLRLPYEPMQPVFDDLTHTTGTHLKTRGEAHITVLTPAEVSGTGLSMSSLVSIAESAPAIDDLELECLGVGIVPGKLGLQTFYLVAARSPKLMGVRRAIAEQGNLDAEDYFPHVTVGFTSRDLFPESDGIANKDVATCPNPNGLILDDGDTTARDD